MRVVTTPFSGESSPDAARLEEALRQVAPRPSRPPAPTAARRGKPAKPTRTARPSSLGHEQPIPTAELLPLVSAEEKALWRAQLLAFSKALSDLRAKRCEPCAQAYLISPELAAANAEALALTMRRYAPAAEERPELRLLIGLAPWLVGIVVVEVANRAAQTAGGGRGRDLRPEGLGKNDANPEFATAPFQMPDC